MRRPRLLAALTVLPLTLTTLALADAPACRSVDPDATADTGDEYELCEVQTYFHRATSHVTNAGYVAADHGLATFDTEAPAGSVTTGNGGGYIAAQALGNDAKRTEATFTGQVTGVVDTVDVDLHLLLSSEDAVFGRHTVTIDLIIGDQAYASAAEVELPTHDAPTASAARKIDFAFTGLASQFRDLSPDAVHDVSLRVRSTYTDAVAVFAFDSSEVPGGIVFNPVKVDPFATRL